MLVIGWSKVSHLTKCWSNLSRPTFDQLQNAWLTSMLVTHCECRVGFWHSWCFNLGSGVTWLSLKWTVMVVSCNAEIPLLKMSWRVIIFRKYMKSYTFWPQYEGVFILFSQGRQYWDCRNSLTKVEGQMFFPESDHHNFVLEKGTFCEVTLFACHIDMQHFITTCKLSVNWNSMNTAPVKSWKSNCFPSYISCHTENTCTVKWNYISMISTLSVKWAWQWMDSSKKTKSLFCHSHFTFLSQIVTF